MPRRREWQLSIREGTGRPSHGILLTRRGGRGRFQASIRGYLLAKSDRAKFRFPLNQHNPSPLPPRFLSVRRSQTDKYQEKNFCV